MPDSKSPQIFRLNSKFSSKNRLFDEFKKQLTGVESVVDTQTEFKIDVEELESDHDNTIICPLSRFNSHRMNRTNTNNVVCRFTGVKGKVPAS